MPNPDEDNEAAQTLYSHLYSPKRKDVEDAPATREYPNDPESYKLSKLTEADRELARVGKVLSEPVRVAICRTIPSDLTRAKVLISVLELSTRLNLPQPTIAAHLKILLVGGLVRKIKRRGCSYYYVDVLRFRRAWRLLHKTALAQPI